MTIDIDKCLSHPAIPNDYVVVCAWMRKDKRESKWVFFFASKPRFVASATYIAPTRTETNAKIVRITILRKPLRTCAEENVGGGGVPMDVHDFLLMPVKVDDGLRHVLLPDEAAIFENMRKERVARRTKLTQISRRQFLYDLKEWAMI